ncbi:rpoC, partial [Symbiodinium necroappetens]
DLLDPLSGEVIVKRNEMIGEDLVERIDTAGIDAVKIRSPLTCESRSGICAKCYGRDLARGTEVNIGEAIGVIASHDAVIQVKNKNVVANSEGVSIVMGRNLEVVLADEGGRERARHRVPYGSRLLVDDGTQVTKGQKLAEWDPYTIPIITEKEGIANYVDLVDGLSMREVTDETTGISSRVVVDWKQQPRGSDLRPRITLRDEKGDVVTLPNGTEARYFMSVDAILSVENGAKVQAGDVLARIPRESTKTRDITGGLPRVAELFEARKPKDYAIIAESEGRVEFGRDYKTKRRILVRPEDGGDAVEYLIPKGKHLAVQEGDYVRVGDLLMDGNPVPHDILDILGVEALAEYLVNEIQSVYRLQGVKISDKHIEVIVRQMLQKVEIMEAGDTTFLVGEQVDRDEYEEANNRALLENGIPAKGKPETTRVLTEAAVNGKLDNLVGLKENVIVGRLIPAGTGSVINRLKRIAAERDAVIEAERSKAELEAAAEAEAATAADV